MARHTRRQRIGGGCVLVSVTGGAHAVRCLSERGVRRTDVLVTIHARRRHGLLVSMRLVTAHALGRGVHHDGWGLPLSHPMTANAILRGKSREQPAVVFHEAAGVHGVRPGALESERVATHAISARLWPEPLLGLARGVLQVRLGFVTRAATRGRYGTERVRPQLVATIARDALLDDVHAMPRHAAVGAPLLRHVDTASGRSGRRLARPFRGASREQRQQQHDERNDTERRSEHCPVDSSSLAEHKGLASSSCRCVHLIARTARIAG